ncbi:MAG TPA: putative toxin-antitoxin system toxin component, PIN family [Candidatus Saccharibacteria bacterium]|nr:putative toxin-antitoxin system toxin component, PIN family [Candidatus Saccharibacteria bacterium]
MIKLVLDTNILLKGFVSARNCERKILNLAMAGKVVIYGSVESFSEYKEKIQIDRIKAFYPNKHLSEERMENLYTSAISLVATSTIDLGGQISDDPDDDEFIKIAVASGSKIVISNDKDLLRLKTHEEIRFIKPNKFLEAYTRMRGGKLYS